MKCVILKETLVIGSFFFLFVVVVYIFRTLFMNEQTFDIQIKQ